jgi:ketosteroid isomerase-like protein
MTTPIKFMRAYEKATNLHSFARVESLIHPKARYFFSDGTFNGRAEIRKAFEKTWRSIKDETYCIKNVRALRVKPDLAVVTYEFSWKGTRQGRVASGKGRGTNTLVKSKGTWQVIGEHLSV